jgi:hypothetical protein
MMKRQKIPAPFIWLSYELLKSDAWRSQSSHIRRLIDFLLLEHLRHGGKKNGLLKAPYRQLYTSGIGAHQAPGAIVQAEELGLVACIRSGMRSATAYRLTWLPGHGDSPPTNEWRAYRNPDLQPLVPRKAQNLHVKQHAGLQVKQHADGQNLHVKQHTDGAPPLHVKQHALYRASSQGKSAPASREASRGMHQPASVVVPWPNRPRARTRPRSHSPPPGKGHP